MSALYEQDIYAWFALQANLLKEKKYFKLDVQHLEEELIEMGESYARELESNLIVLFCHLLKWKYQPKKRSRSWELTIKEHRKRVAKRLQKTPSLKYRLFEICEDAYSMARVNAVRQTGIDPDTFPEEMFFTKEEMLQEGWLP